MNDTLLRTLERARARLAATGPRHRDRRRLVVGAVVGALFTWQTYAIFVQQPGETIDTSDAPAMLLDEFGAGATIAQRFVATSDRLDGVTLWFHADPPRTLDVQCALAVDAGPDLVPVYRWVERVDLDAGRPHTFSFPPVDGSRGRSYRFGVTAVDPVVGVAVESSSANAVRPGFASIDGLEQWGDLRFRTRSATRFRGFVSRARDLPGPFRRVSVALVLLALFNWAAATFVYQLLVAGREEW